MATVSDANKAVGEDVAAVKNAEPDKSTSPGSAKEAIKDKETQEKTGKSQSGNKFFRSNRLSDAELKKRDYVAKELQAAGRVTRSSTVKVEPSGGGGGGSEAPEDEANFMAGIGVISTPGEFASRLLHNTSVRDQFASNLANLDSVHHHFVFHLSLPPLLYNSTKATRWAQNWTWKIIGSASRGDCRGTRRSPRGAG